MLTNLRHYQLFILEGFSMLGTKQACDDALCRASIADNNFVHISSILPPNLLPGCLTEHQQPGDFFFAAQAESYGAVSDLNYLALGVAVPCDRSKRGVIIEITSPVIIETSHVEASLREMLHARGEDATNYRFEIICPRWSTSSLRYGYRGCWLVLF